ncbi:hypothetical protein CR513_42757, partial [Mucuna pruriens]
MINDAFGINRLHGVEPDTYEGPYEFLDNMPNEENEEIGDLLYEGCQKYSKLSFLLRLYHIKYLCGVTDTTMTMILELLKDAFEYVNIPNSFYEETKVMNKLGLNYTKIDVCPRNCTLYWGEDENLEICKHCKKSIWKPKGTNGKKKLLAKVLRYFPLKSRLQRHPRDAKAWRSFDQLYPEFALKTRNIHLRLAIDDFNSYRSMSNSYSIWPVMLIPYNRPPWECMKQTSFILSMTIPKCEQLSYGQLEISWALYFIWVEYLYWLCLPNLCSKNGVLWAIERGHKFRSIKKHFDSTIEERDAPKLLSGLEILKQFDDVNVTFESNLKSNIKGKRNREEDGPKQWKKNSIFFNLPF